MSQFRSEDMSLVQFFIQSDAAHDTLHELGHVGAIQFKDLNVEKSAFQRIFVQDVRKCDDMLRIVRYLQGMLERDKLTSHLDPPPPAMTLNNLHDKLLELEKEMKEQDSSHSLLKAQCIELEEHKQVLHNASKWFGQAYRAGVSFTAPTDDAEGRVEMSALLDDTEGGTQGRRSVSMLGHVAGCIPTANVHDFAVTLFRATRGNMHLKHQELDADVPDVEGEEELKTVFVVFYSGERSRAKVEKICESFGATKYRLPESTAQQDHMEGEVSERLRDLDIVLQRTNEYRRSKLRSIASAVQDWASQVQREKGVFHTLNLFNYDVTHKCLIAEGWVADSAMPEVREALRRGTLRSGASVQTVVNVVKTHEMPPTYFKTTKLTAGFQAIVDAYGMARYKELNPAVFTVITFPFLFGVMFGDIGHGIIMTLVAALLCIFEKTLAPLAADEMFGTVYSGRYNLLLMGLFATYAGFVYNEVFSVPMEAFGDTMWCSGQMTDPRCLSYPGIDSNSTMQKWLRTNVKEAWDFKAQVSTGEEVSWEVYPIGGDPGWAHTGNKLNNANSFKMKFAIVAGVLQMVVGVCCKLANTIHFKDQLTMYFVFVPEIVFINSIFGYLCMLILTKWTTNWDATYVLNNDQVVHIPQVYCKDDLSNMPCWTPPFTVDRAMVPTYGAKLSALPEHMWCMGGGVATAGCAVFEWQGRTIVESNVFGNNTLISPLKFGPEACLADPSGCVMWKQNPPSLLDSLIKMFMEPGYVPIENQLIPGQGGLQAFLILVALVSVPILLVTKPLLLKRQHEASPRFQALHDPEEGTAMDDVAHGGGHGHGEEFNFEEEMVHQMIHTIEYVLGCVSNTASYLRLWALSLAHAQLSEVFWEKTVVEVGLESANPFLIFICIGAWSLFTIGVLMGMESLSAFLHALRLHWVEFMNKFYHGDGYKFSPFDFRHLNEEAE